MTWVQGTAQWQNLGRTLTALAAGEMADDKGVTVAVPDRWMRDRVRTVTDATITANSSTVRSPSGKLGSDDAFYGMSGPGIPPFTTITGFGGLDVYLSNNATASAANQTVTVFSESIRTNPSTDVPSGLMPNRTGYFSNLGTGTANNLATPNAASIRVTAPYSTAYATRWLTRLLISASNTTPGNYSTAQLNAYVMNLDSGSLPVSNNTVAINAAGVATLANGLQVTVSDPSGTLPVSTMFVRGFINGYMYGVDWWPMWSRTAGAATFGTAPPGTAGTDWDIYGVQGPMYGGGGSNTGLNERGSITHGLAIKTATGLGGGDRYTVSFPIAKGKCRIFNTGTNGVLGLDVGGSVKDHASNQLVPAGGMRTANWAKMFSNSGSVAVTTPVQYAMSVTADGIVVVLNGEPQSTGKLGSAYYCAYDPVDPVYDVFPMAFNSATADYTADNASQSLFLAAAQFPYWALRRRQDGTADAVRDWQTGFMRCEHAYYSASFNYSGSSSGDLSAPVPGGNPTQPPALSPLGIVSYTNTTNPMLVPGRQNKPGHDGRWWMYPLLLSEGDWAGTAAGSTTDENRILRGTLNRFKFVPEDGWANWDEITDTGSGAKWLLVKPDYMGTGARLRVTTNTFAGGVAIREA